MISTRLMFTQSITAGKTWLLLHPAKWVPSKWWSNARATLKNMIYWLVSPTITSTRRLPGTKTFTWLMTFWQGTISWWWLCRLTQECFLKSWWLCSRLQIHQAIWTRTAWLFSWKWNSGLRKHYQHPALMVSRSNCRPSNFKNWLKSQSYCRKTKLCRVRNSRSGPTSTSQKKTLSRTVRLISCWLLNRSSSKNKMCTPSSR